MKRKRSDVVNLFYALYLTTLRFLDIQLFIVNNILFLESIEKKLRVNQIHADKPVRKDRRFILSWQNQLGNVISKTTNTNFSHKDRLDIAIFTRKGSYFSFNLNRKF